MSSSVTKGDKTHFLGLLKGISVYFHGG